MAEARIVVVEDEAIVAMDIAAGLRRLGYEVVGLADNGPAAIAMAGQTRPDLVLMDIRLNGPMDGIEAARIIRQQLSVAIVFLTAHGDSATVERTKLAAPHGYLVKPFDEQVLHRVIEVALRRHAVDKAERERNDEALWQSEERFRLLVDAVQDYAIILIDKTGRIVSWNSGAERMTGYTAEEAIGKSISMYYAAEDRDAVEHELAAVRQSGHMELEGWRVRKDGSRFWAQTSRTPVVDRSGEIRGFAAVIRDVTEHRALEAQLLQAEKLNSLGKLAGGIAHDFNNMLMVIFSRVDVLSRLLGTLEPHHRYLEDIRAAAAKSRDLTQQLLAAARRQVLHPQVTDVNEVVRSTMQLLTHSLGEDVKVRTELQKSLWNIYADPGKLHQVLLNLAINAREAMPEGGILIVETRNFRADASFVRQHPQLREGEHVSLIVSDNGHGIPAEIRDRIYDPFFSSKPGGTGLGLAVVRGIVEQTGGQIWLYSEVGQGTTFKIFFPRYQAPREEPAAIAEPELPPDRGSETILLVEDEQLLRSIIRETLEAHGYRVLEARDATEAIALSREYRERIHLLLTDVIMPGMNGPSMAERIGSERKEMRVIYMSGYTDNVVVDRGVLESGVRFLEKPATTNVLLRTVREALSA
ncbi:MAG TPA: response regulator [Thermoanaerobaculia bacterium]|jgi:hypothetical protein